MNEITIYSAEAKDKLTDQIRASTSIAYVCKVTNCDEKGRNLVLASASSTIEDTDLLYPTKSVLVTTSWNRNDDVFSVADTWAARHTPCHKPTNIEHDHTKIVGHITDTWTVGNDGEIIEDDRLSCDLPDLFHLCNGAVIYKYSKDEGIQEQADKLIEEIEAGTKFVSMECLFPAFDYAMSSDDKSYVITRNEDTAFLTKHLRAYGGEGEYNGCRVGRLIKNMVFSGKGYVDTPANPDSIIFDGSSPVPSFSRAKLENGVQLLIGETVLPSTAGTFTSNPTVIFTSCVTEDGVTKKKEHNSMADKLENQLDEQKQLIADLRKANTDLTDQIANASTDKLAADIVSLTEQIDTLTASNEAAKAEVEAAQAEVKAAEAELEKAQAELETAQADIAKAAADKLTSDRIAVLVEGGLDKTAAEEKVTKFANLNDEQFAEVAEAFKVEAPKVDKTDETETEDAEADAETETDDKTLDNVEVEDESAEAGAAEEDTEDNELETAKAGISSFFGQKFGLDTSEDINKE